MKRIKFWKDEESTLIIDIPTLANKGSECYYDTENSESEYAYDSSMSDSEYFPSSSSDNESKSDTSDIFPSIPKIYPRTYNKKRIILRKNYPRINLKNDNKDADQLNDVNKDENLDDGHKDEDQLETISPYQSYGEGIANYGPSSPVYDEDEKDRFERFNISLGLPGNSILEENPEIEFLGYFRNGQFLGYSRNDQLRTESQTEDSNQSPQYSPASPNDSLNEYLMSDSEDNEDTVRARSPPPDIPFSKLWSKVLSMRQNRSRSKSRSRSRSPINRMSRYRRDND